VAEADATPNASPRGGSVSLEVVDAAHLRAANGQRTTQTSGEGKVSDCIVAMLSIPNRTLKLCVKQSWYYYNYKTCKRRCSIVADAQQAHQIVEAEAVPSASPRGGSVSLEVVDAAHLRAANGQRTTQTSGEGKVSDCIVAMLSIPNRTLKLCVKQSWYYYNYKTCKRRCSIVADAQQAHQIVEAEAVPSASPRGGSVSLEVVDAAHLRAANGQRTTQTSGEGKVSDCIVAMLSIPNRTLKLCVKQSWYYYNYKTCKRRCSIVADAQQAHQIVEAEAVPSASPRGGSVSLEVVDAAHLRAANGQRTTQTSGEGKVSDCIVAMLSIPNRTLKLCVKQSWYYYNYKTCKRRCSIVADAQQAHQIVEAEAVPSASPRGGSVSLEVVDAAHLRAANGQRTTQTSGEGKVSDCICRNVEYPEPYPQVVCKAILVLLQLQDM
jgi:hypothetical protein